MHFQGGTGCDLTVRHGMKRNACLEDEVVGCTGRALMPALPALLAPSHVGLCLILVTAGWLWRPLLVLLGGAASFVV